MSDIPEKVSFFGMRVGKRYRSAISSNVLIGTVVGGFVGIVVIALVWTSTTSAAPSPQQSTQLSFNEIALFGGSPSVRSLNSTCKGGAQLEVAIQNPTNENITIQNVTIYGSGVRNATAFIIVSNSCLTIAETSPLIVSGGDFVLEGFVNAPVKYTSSYDCWIKFSNGQILNETIIAQS